ncbi:hypothetical protein GTY67_13300 [Streptomyces sp. SID8374]|uniref:hypothetical protein n=1 Tax=Streptomyces sp. SID8374 TaxID=2690354 RepID=UPI00136F858F|nr:hypothetical protein [Streptomyces sp. SID8374]MYX14373.1 hypothetical protein [Streptomyces sp. SID8374]
MPEPTDPMTELAAAAAQLHELYATYVQAGFTEPQAFELTKAVLLVHIGGGA